MVLSMPQPLRNKSGTYYFRQRVPADLITIVGSNMVQFSLRTKDPKEAKQRHAEELAKVQLRWKALRAKPEPLPHVEIMGFAGELYQRQIKLHVADPHDPELWVALLQLLERLDGGGPEALEQWYGAAVEDLLLEHGVAADEASRLRLIREAHGALQQAGLQLLKQARGDYRPDPDADRFPKLTKGTRKGTKVTIGNLFELWERGHLADEKSPRTPRDHRQKVDDFIAFLKHDDAKRVTPKDVSEWTEHLRHERGLSGKTVADKYLSAVRAVFSVGLAKFVIDSNPAAPVRLKVPKRKVARPKGFTDDEAERVLKAALAAPSAPGNTSPENRLAFRWLPWICAYTGARGGEIAQLRKEDFLKQAGVDCIRITPEAGSVKSGEYRIVPVHPHLIEQGLLKFVEASEDGPLFYKESGRKRGAGTTQARNLVGKVSKWVRGTAKITDPRVQPNHGWRHRFKTLARDVDIGQRYMDAIQGHADGSSSAEYGDNTMKALSREIRKLPRYKVEAGSAAAKR